MKGLWSTIGDGIALNDINKGSMKKKHEKGCVWAWKGKDNYGPILSLSTYIDWLESTFWKLNINLTFKSWNFLLHENTQ